MELNDRFRTVVTSLRGRDLLNSPLLNKGDAFSRRERDELGLHGLIPGQISSMDEQLAVAYRVFRSRSTETDKHLYLRSLQGYNEVLFYRLLHAHTEEMTPIIYTPAIGAICQDYSLFDQRPRGLYVSYQDRDRLDVLFDNWPEKEVDIAVVTDGERVLGLGDLGYGGMGIVIGKLVLYGLCGGLHPTRALPVLLDVGTDNPVLLGDPYYRGLRQRRVRGADYDAFVDTFVAKLTERYPHVLLQWEDFAKGNARRLLSKYQGKFCTFNDDIQGTAAVALAGVLAASKVNNVSLSDHRIVVVGAGSAGTGISELIVSALVEEGLTEQEAVERIWMFNSKGLVDEAQAGLGSAVERFRKRAAILEKHSLAIHEPNLLFEVINQVKPHVLLGVSGQPGVFTEGIVRAMARHVRRPVIFPLSNPTAFSEAIPADLLLWTEGKALVATGSPFAPVLYAGREVAITQCNNSLVFPGIGLGVVCSKSTRVVPIMLAAAARALAAMSPALQSPESALLLPDLREAWAVAETVAISVAEAAQKAKVAKPLALDSLMARITSQMWFPEYPEIRPNISGEEDE